MGSKEKNINKEGILLEVDMDFDTNDDAEKASKLIQKFVKAAQEDLRQYKTKKISAFADEELKHELYKRGYGVVKGDVFDWMSSWLKAYDEAHNTKYEGEVVKWINSQPMSAS